ncbi:hypothetical protein SELR_11150 [Selenomonas ruminantium subsp. lactilytica TAM6421]|uniref:ParB-like N-terminal domain-containing protein n=1 Tax=Selenomonas ruminantium subsp. lactilytica (strain NBRC 103574 / TAM6421) TaxID=927704 RepID=I0GPY6_SELRL|nr:ParB N-terminal domain-containing protein [Selenomonas ruminantium]BAL82823.1 hypothetical protein SELR_11150 [Selenomonas ruminantium subsp. lactilytica TAM6421]
MAFDMMTLMNNKSKAQAAGKGKYELQNIPLEKMIPNPANELIYETGEIEELARSILLTGKVLQNAVVAAADENGNHVIIAGHRRRLACMKLVEEGHTEFAQMPCMVMTEPDDLLQELFLIQTNSTARVLSEAEKMRQAGRATFILNQLKERKQISGRVRDIAAKMLGTTTGQLGRYNVISKGLNNEVLRAAFENSEIGISVAYEAARLSAEEQAALAEKLSQGQTITIRDIVVRQKQAEVRKAAEESEMALPMQMEYMLHIKPRFNMTLTIQYVEKDGKYYAGYQYKSNNAGAVSDINYNFPYDSSQKAIEGIMVELSHYYPTLHEALWESGYSVVGCPVAKEKPAEPKPAEPQAESQAEPSTDENAHDKEETATEPPAEDIGGEELEIEDMRAMWLRKRALREVVKSLNCQVEYEVMQVKMNLESPIRISTHSVMAGIFNEYIIMAKQEIADITARLGDWEELFDQEAGGK